MHRVEIQIVSPLKTKKKPSFSYRTTEKCSSYRGIEKSLFFGPTIFSLKYYLGIAFLLSGFALEQKSIPR